MSRTPFPHRPLLPRPRKHRRPVALVTLALTTAVAAVTLVVLLAPTPAAAQGGDGDARLSAEELIARNIAARGGRERLEAVRSARIRGALDLGQGARAPFVLEWQAPDRVRMEMTMEGMKLIQAFDGEVAWRITPFSGPDPQVLSGEEALSLRRTAADAVRGPLFDPGKRGWQVESLGTEPIDDRTTHKLRLTRGGHEVLLWLDDETFLEAQLQEEVPQPGGMTTVVTRPQDYRQVEGMRFPFIVEQRAEGAPEAQVFRVQQIEIGVDLGDQRFRMETPALSDSASESSPGGG